MMQTMIIIILVAILVLNWVISVKRRMEELEENAKNTMCQIGIQLSSCFDAFIKLSDFVEKYTGFEVNQRIEIRLVRGNVIDTKSTSEDVMKQEKVISAGLNCITRIAEENPELESSKDYVKGMDALTNFKGMVHISHLIYNDTVTRLNREIRRFPMSIIASFFGISERKCIEEEE